MTAERLTRRIRISNEEGLHLRAAALFSQVARTFSCDIRLTCGERHANAKSVWELIGLAAEPGIDLVIEAEGAQSQEALGRLEELVAKRFETSANGDR